MSSHVVGRFEGYAAAFLEVPSRMGPNLSFPARTPPRPRRDSRGGPSEVLNGTSKFLKLSKDSPISNPLHLPGLLRHPGSAARKSGGCRQKSGQSPNFSWSNLLNRRRLISLAVITGIHHAGAVPEFRNQALETAESAGSGLGWREPGWAISET